MIGPAALPRPAHASQNADTPSARTCEFEPRPSAPPHEVSESQAHQIRQCARTRRRCNRGFVVGSPRGRDGNESAVTQGAQPGIRANARPGIREAARVRLRPAGRRRRPKGPHGLQRRPNRPAGCQRRPNRPRFSFFGGSATGSSDFRPKTTSARTRSCSAGADFGALQDDRDALVDGLEVEERVVRQVGAILAPRALSTSRRLRISRANGLLRTNSGLDADRAGLGEVVEQRVDGLEGRDLRQDRDDDRVGAPRRRHARSSSAEPASMTTTS